MSDTTCCVCYEPTEHLTTCNHLVCESCYQKVTSCPMCRAPLGNGANVGSIEKGCSDDDDDDDDDSEDNYETIPVSLINAPCLGNEETAQFALDRIVDLYNEAMVEAFNSGHESIVRLMLDQGATDYNRAMEAASYNGHLDIVQLMLEKRANAYDRAMSTTSCNGHLNI